MKKEPTISSPAVLTPKTYDDGARDGYADGFADGKAAVKGMVVMPWDVFRAFCRYPKRGECMSMQTPLCSECRQATCPALKEKS